MPKISELPLANKLKEEDYIPIVQDGVTKKVKGTHFVTEEEYSLDAFSPTIAANDKAMYKFGEGDTVDFSDSAYDGAYKSAILKGQTLVNLWGDGGTKNIEPNNSVLYKNSMFKTSTKYIIKFNILQSNSSNELMLQYYNDGQWIINDYLDNIKLGLNSFIVTSTSSDFNVIRFFYPTSYGTETVIINDIMIIEYQEGMKNWDIPYFEGMKSVRMPVLKSIGKNLLDVGIARNETINGITYNLDNDGLITVNGTATHISDFYLYGSISPTGKSFYLPKGEYIIGEKIVSANVFFRVKKQNGTTGTIFLNNGKYYDVKEDVEVYGVVLRVESGKTVNGSAKFQLEKGTISSSFEEHKSNILTVNEDVELRGIGDVQDTLDLMTGEVVERIGEVTLDGSENWHLNQATSDNTAHFSAIVLVNNLKVNTDRIYLKPISNYYNSYTQPQLCNKPNNYYGISLGWNDNAICIRDKNFELTDEGLQRFKQHLSQNPITVQYLLETPIIKTVDLSGTPFGYKGGHIIKSSAEGSLLPKFEYEVAVSRGAQISQNTSTLIKHDEKITELLKKTAATYINQKAEIAYLLNMSSTLEEVQTIPFIEDDYVNDDCMVDSDMVMDNMEVEPEKEIIDNADTLLINLIYDLIELNDTLGLSEKVELFRQSGLIDKHNYEIIKEKLNPTFKEEDYADINQ